MSGISPQASYQPFDPASKCETGILRVVKLGKDKPIDGDGDSDLHTNSSSEKEQRQLVRQEREVVWRGRGGEGGFSEPEVENRCTCTDQCSVLTTQ